VGVPATVDAIDQRILERWWVEQTDRVHDPVQRAELFHDAAMQRENGLSESSSASTFGGARLPC
jgi:hypothetical protein